MAEAWTYKKAGLNLDTYEETISGIGSLIRKTHDPMHVLPPPFPPRTASGREAISTTPFRSSPAIAR